MISVGGIVLLVGAIVLVMTASRSTAPTVTLERVPQLA
jgi:hypothetical protein